MINDASNRPVDTSVAQKPVEVSSCQPPTANQFEISHAKEKAANLFEVWCCWTSQFGVTVSYAKK